MFCTTDKNVPAESAVRPRIDGEVDERKLSESFPEHLHQQQGQREELPVHADATTLHGVVPNCLLQDDAAVLFDWN